MDRGTVFFAPFLYSDLEGSKRRPVVVVSSSAYNDGPDVLVAMVTSNRARLSRPAIGDAVVTAWQEAGLLRPSVVRAGRITVLERRLLFVSLGQLNENDLALVDTALRDVLDLS